MTTGTRALRIAMGDDLTVSADATRKAYEVIVWGMGETLTRLSPAGSLEPWLAESVENLGPRRWRVKVRPGAKFWDGSPVDARSVAESFAANWATQPDVNALISDQTRIRVVDDLTLEFDTPEPVGNFPNALAYHQFVVHRGEGTVMTGPYRTVSCRPDRELILEPFAEHWSGQRSVPRLVITVVSDPEARLRALESGEADLAYGLPPEVLSRLGDEIEVASVPSKKLHFIQFNHTRPPFAERELREAVALAVDREALLRGGMCGHGRVAAGLFPPYGGAAVVAIQSTDVDRARRLLDRAGWRPGPDGVRTRDGQRLAFTLYSFPQRREMTGLARMIASQLAPLGFEVGVQEVPSIVIQAAGGGFSAAMRSINSLVTGDPYFLLQAMLARGARTNSGGYSNPEVDRALRELRVEIDPGRRQAISRRIQEVLRADVPNVFLLFTPIVIAIRKRRLEGFAVDPNNEYIVKAGWSLA